MSDASDLPVTWAVDRDSRPCDKCPKDGVKVFSSGGREWCLCNGCYQQVVLDR